ncbi:MAG: thioredoxin domain-containing protein [Acidobacteriales bacterium]|nr:thioredoxin domain-containing protein [Terriglobales bacterium]
MLRFCTSLFIIVALTSCANGQQKTATARPKVAAGSTAKSAGVNLPSEEVVNAFMRQMVGFNPATSWKIVSIRPAEAEGLAEVTVVISSGQGAQPNKFFVTADGRHAVTGDLIPFGATPFAAARAKLEKGITGPERGPKDAAVTIVEFSDLQCPHCKAAQPTIDKVLAEEKGVRLVFQNFPLESHDWAEKAADYADCIGRTSNDAFWKFIQGAYDAQDQITASNADEKLNAIADAAGAKSADIAVCAAKPETAGRVQHSLALGKSLDVNSTPSLFINGRLVAGLGSVPYETLKSLVDFAVKEQQK